MSFHIRRLITLCFAVIMTALSWSALAGQQQNANLYAFYKWSGGPFGQNVDQQLSILQKGRGTYWAMLWNMDNSNPSESGYMGLQTGTGTDTQHGGIAIFSIWGSIGYSGPHCLRFPYESGGTGFSCRIPYNTVLNHWYRLRVWKISADSKSVWWGAWVKDETTGVETYIGKIQVPAAETSLSHVVNFSEYYGDAVAAPNLVPRSIIYWATPNADFISPGKYRFTSVFQRSTKADGTTGSVVNIGTVKTSTGPAQAIRIIQGG